RRCVRGGFRVDAARPGHIDRQVYRRGLRRAPTARRPDAAPARMKLSLADLAGRVKLSLADLAGRVKGNLPGLAGRMPQSLSRLAGRVQLGLPVAAGRIRMPGLAGRLAIVTGVLVTLAVASMLFVGVRSLRSLAQAEALTRRELGVSAARAAMRQSLDDVLIAAGILRERRPLLP